MKCRDERHSRKKSKTSNCGHRPFRGTCRGNRPRNGDRGRNQFPTGAAVSQTSAANGNSGAPQTEDAAAAKEKAYAAMQEALKNLEAAKDAASPEKLAEIDDDIASFQEIHDMVVTEAAKRREPLPAMQANVDAAQAKYDEAHNRTSGLQAELDKVLKELGDEAPSTAIKEHIKQLRSEIMAAERREESCEDDLHRYQRRLESQENRFSISKVRQRKLKPTSTRT